MPTITYSPDRIISYAGNRWNDFTLDAFGHSWTPGTLSYAASQQTVAGLTGRQRAMFSTLDNGTPTYVRNTNRIIPAANLTAIGTWRTNSNNAFGVTAITPRFCQTVNHLPAYVGSEVRFVTLDNAIVTREIVDSFYIYGDLSILELDSDLPGTITPAKVMPANWADYLGQTGLTYLAAFHTDAYEQLSMRRISTLGSPTNNMSNSVPAFAPFVPWGETNLIGGSSEPIFLIVDNLPVVLCGFYTINSGTPIHHHLAAIEATTGPLNYLDLSPFERFA